MPFEPHNLKHVGMWSKLQTRGSQRRPCENWNRFKIWSGAMLETSKFTQSKDWVLVICNANLPPCSTPESILILKNFPRAFSHREGSNGKNLNMPIWQFGNVWMILWSLTLNQGLPLQPAYTPNCWQYIYPLPTYMPLCDIVILWYCDILIPSQC